MKTSEFEKEKMEELSNYLKSLREKQGLSLEELASNTKISLQYLAAMEENRWEEIPSKVHQKLFLKAYLEQLGLEPSEISERLKAIRVSEEIEFSPLTFIKKKIFLDYVLIASGVILLLIILWTLFKQSPTDDSQSKAKQIQFNSSQMGKLPASFSKQTLAEREQNRKLILRLEATDKSWLEIIADADTIYKGFIHRSQKKEWSCQDNFIINLGNPRVVKGFINGQQLRPWAKLPKTTNYWEINIENYRFLLEEKKSP